MTTFSESEAEQLALKLLERLSWTVKYGLDFILTDAPAAVWNTILLERASGEVAQSCDSNPIPHW